MIKNLCDSCIKISIEQCDAMYHEVQFYKDIDIVVDKVDKKKVYKCFKYGKKKK